MLPLKPLNVPSAGQKQRGSPSEAWFCSSFLLVSEGVFPCYCHPRLALRGSQARALCKACYFRVRSQMQTRANAENVVYFQAESRNQRDRDLYCPKQKAKE